ncbi:hypothetical protein DFP72DRAFT_985770 [Ephemerocybe angulata]|uniref:CxC6 like cysteine cluster associated with KDZ domain-containing protein n=1 Tax=Ephemerocybe angulata TaxID=980116 RepID=A0A8H6IHD1_9AGAR|nr:hypothetical protein DFP72DRAFT_985770 [Tulosesus angulatus]
MVVVDGIVMGTTHCAYPDCTGPLANHRGESFCWVHKEMWGNRCRVVGCNDSRTKDSYACNVHQPLWKKYQREHSRAYLAGLRRALQKPGDSDATEWQNIRSTNTQRHDEPQDDSTPRTHYFGPNHFYCVETICAPCGTVIAWAAFAKSESPTKILGFLSRVFPDQVSRPLFICIDKACLVLRTAVSNGSWSEWQKTSCFIIDTYHYINHKASNDLCRTWCNPAPANGSQPNLVIVSHDASGQPYLKRAFNTQVGACEQLNSWLGGFESILKRMVMSNFQWFLHVMLFYHTRFVILKQETRQREASTDADNGCDDQTDRQTDSTTARLGL